MGTTFIDRLLAEGSAIAGSVYRALAVSGPGGVASPLQADADGSLKVSPQNSDVFGRLPVSQPFALWTMKQTPNGQSAADLQSVTSLTGGGTATYLAAGGRTLAIPGGGAATSILQGRQYVPYEPGRQNEVIVTGTLGAPVAGVTKRMGQFDSLDGTFFEVGGTDLAVSIRKAGADTSYIQSAWNKDTLDGTGPSPTNPSGLSLDSSALVVLVVQYGWLGGAGVRFGFEFDTKVVWAHWAPMSGLTSPFMDRPALPVRWEISGTSAASMVSTCGAVLTSGGLSNVEAIQVSHLMETPRTVGTTWLPLLSVRLDPATPRGLIKPKYWSIMTDDAALVMVRISLRGSLTGGSWASSSGPVSQVDEAATAISGGIYESSGFLNATGSGANSGGVIGGAIDSKLIASSDFSGVPDTLSIECRVASGTADIYGSITWEEISE